MSQQRCIYFILPSSISLFLFARRILFSRFSFKKPETREVKQCCQKKAINHSFVHALKLTIQTRFFPNVKATKMTQNRWRNIPSRFGAWRWNSLWLMPWRCYFGWGDRKVEEKKNLFFNGKRNEENRKHLYYLRSHLSPLMFTAISFRISIWFSNYYLTHSSLNHSPLNILNDI